MKKFNWSAENIDYLVRNYPDTKTIIISEHFGLSISAVYQKAYSMKLKKSAEFLSSPECGILIKGTSTGKEFRFIKGHVSANKGKTMTEDFKEKVKHTFFQKGHTPKNTKHDGYISIRTDNKGRPYAHIRTSLGRFCHLHRHIWEQANGEVPEGLIVVFKNGDTADIRLDNLELVTRRELLFRNRWKKYPIELREAQRMLLKLKKSISDYEKQQSDSAQGSLV